MTARLERAAIVAGALVLLFVVPHGMGADGAVRMGTLQKLVDEGVITDRNYSIVQPLLSVPLYVVGKALGAPWDVTATFSAWALLAMLVALWRILRPVVDADALRRFTLLTLCASMYAYHVTLYYAEVLTAACVAVGVALFVRGRRVGPVALFALGIANTPGALPALAMLVVERLRRRREALWLAAGCAAAVALILLENFVRRGDPLLTGYEHGHLRLAPSVMPYAHVTGFHYPLMLGLLSELFSFGRGLLFYAPGLLLCFVPLVATDEERAFQRLNLAFVAGLLLLYAKWFSWHGALWCGPRFLLYASIPATFALARHVGDRAMSTRKLAVVLAILLWSGWVGLVGAVQRDDGASLDAFGAAAEGMDHLHWYVVEYASLFHPFVHPQLPTMPLEQVAALYFVVANAIVAAPLVRELALRLYGSNDVARTR